MSKYVFAGAVLWRSQRHAAPEVAIIHRPRYDDWSLPKGKVDPGETEPVTAVREVQEETGYTARPGRRLAGVSYPVEQGTKKVRYWAARRIDGDFAPNAGSRRAGLVARRRRVGHTGYPHEKCCAGSPEIRRHADGADVRHGTAGSKSRYRGDDRKRRWTNTAARRRSRSSVNSSPSVPASCMPPTGALSPDVEPLAEELGVSIHNEPALTEEAYSDDRKRARQRVLEIAAAGGTPVICTKGDSRPHRVVVRADGATRQVTQSKGSTWAVVAGGRLVAADHIGSPLAAKK